MVPSCAPTCWKALPVTFPRDQFGRRPSPTQDTLLGRSSFWGFTYILKFCDEHRAGARSLASPVRHPDTKKTRLLAGLLVVEGCWWGAIRRQRARWNRHQAHDSTSPCAAQGSSSWAFGVVPLLSIINLKADHMSAASEPRMSCSSGRTGQESEAPAPTAPNGGDRNSTNPALRAARPREVLFRLPEVASSTAVYCSSQAPTSATARCVSGTSAGCFGPALWGSSSASLRPEAPCSFLLFGGTATVQSSTVASVCQLFVQFPL